MADGAFRPPRPDEFDLLDQMTLAGVRYWGTHEKFPDAYNGLVADVAADDPTHAVIYVIEEDGEVVAFYDLRDRGDYIELYRMFQRVDLIGSGYGRRLWEHCIAQAAERADRMLIKSDPGAVGFYEAMGAKLEKQVEIVPGFRLGRYWYDLT